jgi:hypothetical protein
VPEEYAECYAQLQKLGFEHIAVGGLLKRRENTVRYANVRSNRLLEDILKMIREGFDPDWLFAFGAFHPGRIPLFKEHGVWGADYRAIYECVCA